MATGKQLIGGISVAFVLGALVVGGATGNLPFMSSANSDPADNGSNPGPNVATGDEATVSIAAFSQTSDSNNQVATTAHAWRIGDSETYDLGSASAGADSRASYTEFVTGTTAKVTAFDSTYDYGVVKEKFVDQVSELVNIKVWQGVSPSNVGVTFFGPNGNTVSSVDLSADERVTLDGMQVGVNVDDRAYNPKVVLVNKVDGSNLSKVSMPNAEKIAMPNSAPDRFDKAYAVYPATEDKEPLLTAYEKEKSGAIVLKADADGTSGESLEFAVLDSAPYIEGNEVKWGVENAATPAQDTGVSMVTSSITLN
ncbi:hypothetical protein [Haloarcula litorea]|uniref:hypothetical protein n=1 Tax=Haloarcula litorea TaxID=3032579 RepID=UPI0023E83386|nr:hypothetical protein [Halomicroarcula sp. GDY20]